MNPELQRNLWLEAGPRRLAWVATVLAVIYGAAVVIGGAASDSQGLARALFIAGAGVFAVSGLIWGPRAAGRSIGAEVMQRTWDFQRLSVLTPWQMTAGKLLGATSASWMAALSGLVVANAAVVMGAEKVDAPAWTLAAVASALLLQAGSLALALVGVRRARADGRPANLRIGWASGFGFLLLVSVAGKTLPHGAWIGSASPFAGGQGWWGMDVPNTTFAALSLTAFAVWAVIAAWRLMRLELQMQNWPWAWPGFLVFAALYAAGFAKAPFLAWAAAGVVFGVGAYASAFAEPADRVRLRHWVEAIRRRDWRKIYLTVPAPYTALKLSAVAAVGLMLSAPERAQGGGVTQPGLMALAAFAFLVRDVGMVAYFRFGPRSRRGDFGAVLGLFLLYFVGGMVGNALGGRAGAALFVPSPFNAGASVLAGTVMAVLAWGLAWSRIRAPERTEEG